LLFTHDNDEKRPNMTWLLRTEDLRAARANMIGSCLRPIRRFVEGHRRSIAPPALMGQSMATDTTKPKESRATVRHRAREFSHLLTTIRWKEPTDGQRIETYRLPR
jgi:hypothetical protein